MMKESPLVKGFFNSSRHNFPGLLVSVFSNQIFNTNSAGVIPQQKYSNRFIGKKQEKTGDDKIRKNKTIDYNANKKIFCRQTALKTTARYEKILKQKTLKKLTRQKGKFLSGQNCDRMSSKYTNTRVFICLVGLCHQIGGHTCHLF